MAVTYEKELQIKGDTTKEKTMAGWGYQWQWSDQAKGIGGYVPTTTGAKAKYQQLYGEDFSSLLDKSGKLKMATLYKGTNKVAVFGGKAYSAGLFSQGYNLWTGQNPNAVINQNQQTDFTTKEAEKAPPTNMPALGTPEDYLKPYTDLMDKYMGDTTKPALPNMEQAFRDEMTKYGIPELEQSVVDLTKQKQDEEALQRERKTAEEGKPVALGVIGGRMSEIDRQAFEKLDYIGRQIDYATNQLNNKYSMVNTIMNLKNTDYTNAANAYNSQFSQAMQMIEFTKGVMKDYRDEQWRTYSEEQRIKERGEDTARANLQVIYNNITAGTTDYNNLDPSTKANITKMEMESGFPVGFVKNLYNANPKQDIVSTTSRQESNGDSYADVIMRDKKSGALSVQHVFLGKAKITGTGSGSGSGSYTMSKDEVGGVKFEDSKGNAVTAGQYAAKTDKNLLAILRESGNPDDKTLITNLQSVIDDVAAGRTTIEEAYALLQQYNGWIFEGVSKAEFVQMLGLEQGTQKKSSGF